ncbi:MAG: CotS family spore coat protein [Lachnospiraceae bacterium]|nr:CotS family spore coat protein [Lachnospiraceae bacterium]
MNEKNLKVLEQYELEIRNMRKGRGSYILDTNRGLVLLKEYNGSEQRAVWIENVCSTVNESGMRADLPIANKEGHYVSSDRDEKRYMLKSWVAGREIDLRDSKEIYGAVKNLAALHTVLHGFDIEDSKTSPDLEQLFTKRMRELRKIMHYIKDKKRKNAFEMDFMKYYESYFQKCSKALELASKESVRAARNAIWKKGNVCHGDYNQHNILKEDHQFVTVNFENCRIGSQTEDLYCFMRKMLEKHNWDLQLASEMMDLYMGQRELSQEELQLLYIQFLFSEKFWKIANHYYNSKKTWIPDRSQQKLDVMIQQLENQNSFLEYFYSQYVS